MPEQFRQALVAAVPKVRRYAYSLAGTPSDADDLLQMTVQRALVKHEQFLAGSEIERWLFRICRNIWIDEMRSQRARGETVEFDDALAGAEDGERAMNSRLTLRKVGAAMSKLSEGQREVLSLVGVEGLSYAEAASVLGVPIGTVMSRLARARGQLINLLEA